MGVLTILQPDESFPYRVEGHDEAVLTLRILTDAQIKAARKKATTTKWHNGQRIEDFDPYGFAEDVLDAAVASWTGVCGSDGLPLPCTREIKAMLPDRVKVAIVKMCASKEPAEGGESAGEA